ncbi:DUF6461 domain-containing protein [Streptomyces antibioticus]|uniref:DUF6461 domain-containing protein n=1 Tax=Streptomyces antibioticus TaxID=1890 RepID=UPI0022521F26|nr:DUF6461 domain-containing protein [Streptomyces antibioticus]MCX4742471.1 DUF6461 domain-containing protein [Streptomyces antibioticus]
MINDGLQWLPEVFPLGFTVTFARALAIDDMVTRMGGDPSSLSPLTRVHAEKLELENRDAGPVVRFGEANNWAFAVESWGAVGSRSDVICRVSISTEAVAATVTASATKSLTYAKNGEIFCRFDADVPQFRKGTHSDVLLPHMERAGLMSLETEDVNTRLAMLAVAEAAFDLTLPRNLVARGELVGTRLAG